MQCIRFVAQDTVPLIKNLRHQLFSEAVEAALQPASRYTYLAAADQVSTYLSYTCICLPQLDHKISLSLLRCLSILHCLLSFQVQILMLCLI